MAACTAVLFPLFPSRCHIETHLHTTLLTMLNFLGSVTFYSPLSDVPENGGSSFRTPSLSPPLSPLSIIPPLFGCPCECPRCNGCFTAPTPALSPFQD